jgi:hypothetical protein
LGYPAFHSSRRMSPPISKCPFLNTIADVSVPASGRDPFQSVPQCATPLVQALKPLFSLPWSGRCLAFSLFSVHKGRFDNSLIFF